MGKGTKGLIVNLDDVKTYGKRMRVFNVFDLEDKEKVKARRCLRKGKKMYRIDGDFCFEERIFFVDGQRVLIETAKVPIEDIYPQIEYLFDENNIVIAERCSPNKKSRLISTGKGMFRKKKSVDPNLIYWLAGIDKERSL